MLLINKLLGIVPMVYREGGGKSGGGQVATPQPISTITSVGVPEAPVDTFEEDAVSGLDKKKIGTRGLRIPMADTTYVTPSASGVQL